MNRKKVAKISILLFVIWFLAIYIVLTISSYVARKPIYPSKNTHTGHHELSQIADLDGEIIDRIPSNVQEDDAYLVYDSRLREWLYYSPATLHPEYDFIKLNTVVPSAYMIRFAECNTFTVKINDEHITVSRAITMIDAENLDRGMDGKPVPGFHKDVLMKALSCAAKDVIPYVAAFIIIWFLFYLYIKLKKIIFPLFIAVLLVLVMWLMSLNQSSYISKAPIIYLYPEEEQNVSVILDINGSFRTTYPLYEEEGWQVTASPDGTLMDSNGRTYNYLFWEADLDFEPDFSEGFCVAGEDTAEFLEDALHELGLTDSEANTFIMYWLPSMRDNNYNVISFQTSRYEDAARLDVTPQPDSEIRVFMAFYSVPYEVSIDAQDLSSLNCIDREGFTLVEWGGAEVGSIDGEFRRIMD